MKPVVLVHFNHQSNGSLTRWPDMRVSSWKPNYGDMLVCASLLRQIALPADVPTTRINFGDEFDLDAQFALIRGSTYLHNEFDFDAACRTLNRVKGPLAIVGLGAQNPSAEAGFLDSNDGARRFISLLNERCASISVRGAFTAEVVRRLGGKNIRVTGCPSLFYRLLVPDVRVPEMLLRPERNLGVSIHTGLSNNMYCRSPERARYLHSIAIGYALQHAANVSLFEQGVMTEFRVADRSLPINERLASAQEMLSSIGAEGSFSVYDLISRMVSVESIEEWLAKARDVDAIIGFRFHGNMVALLQGYPCFYFTYDSRLEEFCNLYHLPYRNVENEWIDPIDAIVSHDWGETNRRIAACYSELRYYYHENSVPHNL